MAAAGLRAVWFLPCLAVLGGCAHTRTQLVSYQPATPPCGVVLVADGAGGLPEAARALKNAVAQSGAPLLVRSFDWTHGRGRGLLDMTDTEHAQAQGRCLAAHVASYRKDSPQMPIYLMAYSAGTHVALEATRYLEPDTLERVVLLAPAVSADYDLAPALRAARNGVDAFSSKRDRLFLGLGPRVVGTADGKRGIPVAGRVGFDPPSLEVDDARLASRLRQHPWDPSLAASGNYGGHGGPLRLAYFRVYVLPLFTTP